MKVKFGNGATVYGPGIIISLTGDDVASAITTWLMLKGVYISGPRTVSVNDELCEKGNVHVDPSGYVIHNGQRLDGRGPDHSILNSDKVAPHD